MKSNHILLIGYVGKELKSLNLQNGSKRLGIRMATHYYHKNKQGEKINHTVWHNVVAWDHIAEFAQRSFVKGSKIMVEGSIAYRMYPDRQGHTRYLTLITANSLMNLDR